MFSQTLSIYVSVSNRNYDKPDRPKIAYDLQAQWYIFDKVKAEGFTGNEYARLRCDVLVPKKMIGRIIGKILCSFFHYSVT